MVYHSFLNGGFGDLAPSNGNSAGVPTPAADLPIPTTAHLVGEVSCVPRYFLALV